MYIYIYICICTYMHAYIHTYIHTYITFFSTRARRIRRGVWGTRLQQRPLKTSEISATRILSITQNALPAVFAGIQYSFEQQAKLPSILKTISSRIQDTKLIYPQHTQSCESTSRLTGSGLSSSPTTSDGHTHIWTYIYIYMYINICVYIYIHMHTYTL